MNTDILSIDPIIIEEMPEEPTTLLIGENETILQETRLPLKCRFGIVDLWKLRSTKDILFTTDKIFYKDCWA